MSLPKNNNKPIKSNLFLKKKQDVNLSIPLQTDIINFDIPLSSHLYNTDVNIEIKTQKQLSGKQYLLVIPITKFFKKARNLFILINILNGKSIISLRLIEYFVVNYVLENNTFYNILKYKNKFSYIIDNLFNKEKINNNTSNLNDVDRTSIKNEIVEDIENKISLSSGENIDLSLSNKSDKSNKSDRSDKSEELTSVITDNFDDYFLVHDNYKCQLKEYNKINFDPFCRWSRIRLYYEKNKFFFTTVAQLNFFKWIIENYILDYILDNLTIIEKSMLEHEKKVKEEKAIRYLKLNEDDVIDNTENLEINGIKPIYFSKQESNIIKSPETLRSEKRKDELKEGLKEELKEGLKEELKEGLKKEELSKENVKFKNVKTKKRELGNNQDKRTKLKGRKKKEFTKTNRSILKYHCSKIITFD